MQIGTSSTSSSSSLVIRNAIDVDTGNIVDVDTGNVVTQELVDDTTDHVQHPMRKKRKLNSNYTVLQAKANQTFKNSHKDSTIKTYSSQCEACCEFLHSNDETKTVLLYDARGNKSINYAMVQSRHIVAYFETFQMLDLTRVWVRDWMTNIKKQRSSIKYFRGEFERKNPDICSGAAYIYAEKVYEMEMARWIKGACKEEADLRKEGRLPAAKGKMELTLTLYKHFASCTFEYHVIYNFIIYFIIIHGNPVNF